jgi:hypothetical protein
MEENISINEQYANKLNEEIKNLVPSEAIADYRKLEEKIKDNFDTWAATKNPIEMERLSEESVELKLKKYHIETVLGNRAWRDYSAGKISRDEAKRWYMVCGRSIEDAEEALTNIDTDRIYGLPSSSELDKGLKPSQANQVSYQANNKSSEIEAVGIPTEEKYNTFKDVIKKYYPHLNYGTVEEGYYLFPDQVAPGEKYDPKRLYVNQKGVMAGDGNWKLMDIEHEKQFRGLSDDWDNASRGGGKKEWDEFDKKWIKNAVSLQTHYKSSEIEAARKAGYVQGVCECVAAIGGNHTLGKKLLSEMKVDKDMAKKFANPETFKVLEQGVFAQINEQKQEQTHSIKR